MSTKTLSQQNARMDRIQTASGRFRMLNLIIFLMAMYGSVAFCFGWPFLFQGKVRIPVSPQHIYASPSEMPGIVAGLMLVRFALWIFCAWVLNNLFRLYQQGIIFSAKNVRYIHFLGYYLIADWGVHYSMQASVEDLNLSFTPVFVGGMINFIAWIMDAGREIQEEQELTV